MGKRRGGKKNGSNEDQYIRTQANLDKHGKTNKKLRRNPLATKYLTAKGKELKAAGEALYKENMAKHKAKLSKAS